MNRNETFTAILTTYADLGWAVPTGIEYTSNRHLLDTLALAESIRDARNEPADLPFCDECREGRGFIEDGYNSGWCGECFGGHVDGEMYDAIREANDTMDAIEEALDAEAALDAPTVPAYGICPG